MTRARLAAEARFLVGCAAVLHRFMMRLLVAALTGDAVDVDAEVDAVCYSYWC